MEICLMIEGQEDVTWEDWRALAAACEAHGIGTMFRSDHYLSVAGRRERGSLDAWGTINALAAITETLRLGTMVSPATFRHPAVLAKLAVTADHVSGGRVEVGIGAGWWEREHELYGFELPPVGPRMDALAEQMQVVRGHWGPGPFDFDGQYFSARGLDAQPKPVQRPLPLILGGKGGPRSLRLAARHADEYNTVMATAAEVAEIRAGLDAACEAEGRDPATLPLSMMTGRERARESTITGSAEQAVEQLCELEAVGLTRLMGQHLTHRDLEMVAQMGEIAATMRA
jgi:alkanesulfonate monooxygenase SsuD/methylene tetrahydromethanopterin reductase-like flavin-dependent oxidoreductase (luciferase family)